MPTELLTEQQPLRAKFIPLIRTKTKLTLCMEGQRGQLLGIGKLFSTINAQLKVEPKGIRINDNMLGRPFEDIFRDIGLIQIQADVAEVIKQMLSTATVNFGGNNNEISERSLGGKSNQERPSDGKKDSSD